MSGIIPIKIYAKEIENFNEENPSAHLYVSDYYFEYNEETYDLYEQSNFINFFDSNISLLFKDIEDFAAKDIYASWMIVDEE